jgi:hypothetical protein
LSGGAGAGLVIFALTIVLTTLRPTTRAHARSARSFGKWAGLEIPPELVGWVGARVRRRAVARLAVGGPVFIAMMFLIGDGIWADFHSNADYPSPSTTR